MASRAPPWLSMTIVEKSGDGCGLDEDDGRRVGGKLAADGRDVRADLRGGEDDRLDPLGDHELDDGADIDALGAVDLLEQDAIAGRLRLLGDAVERLGDAEVAQAGDDDAEGLRPALDQAARDGARLEPRLRDRRLDGRAGLRARRPVAC